MIANAEYPNLRSRLLLNFMYETQFVIPKREPHKAVVRFLRWYERHVLKVDTSGIVVDRPIFLMGLPRSGTTMLQDLLCTHPDLAYITNTMHQFRHEFCGAEMLRQRLGLDFEGERFLEDSVSIRPGSPNEGHMFYADWSGVDVYSLEYRDLHHGDMTAEQVEEANEFIRRVIWCFGKDTRFFNKNPNHLTSIQLINELHPDAKIIHIVRDARMCANSMIKLYRKNVAQEERVNEMLNIDAPADQRFIPYPRLPKLKEYIQEYGPADLRTTANLWNDAISYVDERKGQISAYHEVRYEDILANPRAEIFTILDFCELTPPAADNAAFWEKMDAIGDVHHKNSYGDFELIEAICRDNMQKYGYL